jgi:hypothetical protein
MEEVKINFNFEMLRNVSYPAIPALGTEVIQDNGLEIGFAAAAAFCLNINLFITFNPEYSATDDFGKIRHTVL